MYLLSIYQINLGNFSYRNKLRNADISAKHIIIYIGVKPFISATWGANIVALLAATLQNPQTVVEKIVGINWIPAM